MKNLPLLLILFASCTTPQKAVDVLSRPKNEPTAAKFCADKFPVHEYYVTGDTLVKIDTLWGLVTDTIETKDTVFRVVTKVEPKIITKTILRVDTAYKENTAKVRALELALAKSDQINRNMSEMLHKLLQERDELKKERNKWRLRFFLLLFGVTILYGLKVKMTKKLW